MASILIGMTVGGLWLKTVSTIGGVQIIYFLLLLIVFTLAVQGWRRNGIGFLSWGGEYWMWTTAHVATIGSVTVHLDVQFLMILTMRDEYGQEVWIWAERTSYPAGWSDLRRAIYANKQTGSVIGKPKKDAKAVVTL